MSMRKREEGQAGRLRVQSFLGLCAVLAATVMVCSALSALQARYHLHLDLTPTAMTRLSRQTKELLERTDEDVRVHLVFQASTASDLRMTLETLAERYAAEGRGLTVDTVDPVTEPNRLAAFTSAGTPIAEGSVVVTNADESRFKVVNAREMYAYTATKTGGYAVTGVNAEQRITSAIAYVTSEDMPRVRFLTGHGEASMESCGTLLTQLAADNYEFSSFALQTGAALESDDVLLILSPARDLTDAEFAELTAWLDGGGRLFYALDATADTGKLPRFAELAARYSLAFEPGIVVEAQTAADNWMNSPLYLVPDLNRESQALKGMGAQMRVILPGARAVSGPQIPLSGYTYETLLTTSPGAYRKRTDSEAFTREAGDPVGKQQLAVAVSHADDEGAAQTRAVFMGSLYTAVDSSLLLSTYNLDLMIRALAWLSQREDGISIPAREIADTGMAIPSAAAAYRILALTLALPAAAACVGVGVMIRRRKR